MGGGGWGGPSNFRDLERAVQVYINSLSVRGFRTSSKNDLFHKEARNLRGSE